MWLIRWAMTGGVVALIILVLLSLDFKQVQTKTTQAVETLDRQYRGVSDFAGWVGDTTKSIASAVGFVVDAPSQVFYPNLTTPLETGLNSQGYHVFSCDRATPEVFCTIRYPQRIVWTAGADGDVVTADNLVAFSAPEIPGFRFLFTGGDPTASGKVKRGQTLVTSARGEIAIAVQWRTENGWEFVPLSRETFYWLIQPSR